MPQHLLRDFLSAQPKNGDFYLIAVDGRGGSGKTVLGEYLTKLLPDFLILNGDDYFEPTPGETAWGDFNDDRFAEDVITPLRKGQQIITYRPYDWHTEPHISEKKLTVKKGVCIERSFSFNFDLDWDLKIWVEAPRDLSLQRGLERDQMPREQAVAAWEKIWRPREDSHIESVDPLKTADIVLDGTKPFEEQLGY